MTKTEREIAEKTVKNNGLALRFYPSSWEIILSVISQERGINIDIKTPPKKAGLNSAVLREINAAETIQFVEPGLPETVQKYLLVAESVHGSCLKLQSRNQHPGCGYVLQSGCLLCCSGW